MVIRRLKIKNFGKIRDKDMELSPGINVLYGENESGKTTNAYYFLCHFLIAPVIFYYYNLNMGATITVGG